MYNTSNYNGAITSGGCQQVEESEINRCGL